MGHPWRRAVLALTTTILATVAASSSTAAGPDDDDPPREPPSRTGPPRLVMTRAVPCISVLGYEDYVERTDSTLTVDEKLVIYYRPEHFATERVDDEYRAHLIQDARIRRHGDKKFLQSKDKIVDYLARGRKPPANLYLTNSISLSDLRPGDYDLDIILHDAISKGPPARQTLQFTIIPEPDDEPPPKQPGRRKPQDDEP